MPEPSNMNIVTTRRISQIFFFIVFIWFCFVTSPGDRWWQLRGWPVNWILELDPLVGLATLLSTRTVYAGLLWGLATIVLFTSLSDLWPTAKKGQLPKSSSMPITRGR
jgi:hypothetical protein